MINLEAAINLTPVFKVLFYAVAVGFSLFIIFWIGFFVLHAIGAAIGALSGSGDEFGEVIVFWGGVAIVVAVIALAFSQHIVAFE